MRKGLRMTQHHYLASSRGGTIKETVDIPDGIHQAYHYLFANLTIREAETFIMTLHVMFETWGEVTMQDINDLRDHIKGGD